jgi:hypothetical protein
VSNVTAVPLAPTVALAVGLYLTVRYAWVLDDAFIYFRYADNAALLGAGLVYNKGEYVEGYTSPLWMLLLLVIRLLHLRYWPVLVATGVGAMFAAWLLAIRVNRRLVPEGTAAFHLPAIFVASCYAVQSHFTSGLETPLVQVFALAFAALVVEPAATWLHVMVALGPLIRPELSLAYLIAIAWCWVQGRRMPRVLVGVGLGTALGWLIFRACYYGDFAPNTFYLKDTLAVSRGLHYVHDTLRAYYLYWLLGGLLLLLVVAIIVRGRHALRLGPRAVLLLTAALHTAYVIRVGGDFVHYRYLAFPVLVAVASLGGVVETLLVAVGRAGSAVAFVVGLVFTALMLSAYPRAQLPTHPFHLKPEGDSLLQFRVDQVEDATTHRWRYDLAHEGWDTGADEVKKALRGGVLSYRMVFDTAWCREGYAHLDWFAVQSLGLTDPVIAHVIEPAPSHQAGHRWSLMPLARDLVRARLATSMAPPAYLRDGGPTVFDQAAQARGAPRWIVRNLDALDTIERRTHHPRTPWADVVDAFHPWPRIRVSRADLARAARH